MNPCAIVTGGSRNIGKGIAITLAKDGYDVAITYASHMEGALDTKRQIEEIGQRCFIYEAQLEAADSSERVIMQAYRDLGRLDLMVCNAGRELRGSILTFTADDLDFQYTNSLRHYMLCTGAAARLMIRDKVEGSIILITSVRANLVHPEDFFYGAMKAGMERACKSMALDLSEFNIRVNCVAPGAIWDRERVASLDSPFIRESIPLHRVGEAEEIGEAVVYMAKAKYVTGTTLLVDGGLALPGMMEGHNAIPWKHEEWSKNRYERAMEILKEEENK